jgi:hypothetical protein
MITQEMTALLKYYNEGLKKYKKGKFKEALSEFEKALEIIPNDGPTQVYIKRCKEYIEIPPPIDWDGVYTMKTK